LNINEINSKKLITNSQKIESRFSKPNFVVAGQIKSATIKKMIISSKTWFDKVKEDMGVSKSGSKIIKISDRKKLSSQIIEDKKEKKEEKEEKKEEKVVEKKVKLPSSSSSLSASPSPSGFVNSNYFLVSYLVLYLLVIYIATKV
jgi:hypothetical protein